MPIPAVAAAVADAPNNDEPATRSISSLDPIALPDQTGRAFQRRDKPALEGQTMPTDM
ncbi:hypothetical protein HK405_002455, partial [Cladochytrium tenue]